MGIDPRRTEHRCQFRLQDSIVGRGRCRPIGGGPLGSVGWRIWGCVIIPPSPIVDRRGRCTTVFP